jgi:hypothetical protein
VVLGAGWVRSAFDDTDEGAACAGVIVVVTKEAKRARRALDGDGLGVFRRGGCREAR